MTLGAATLTVGTNNFSVASYAGVISGTGGVTKVGTGTQTFTGANTYTGITTIQNGALALGTLTGATVGGLAATSAMVLGDGLANTSGMFVLGDAGNPANQTLASLTMAGTGTANAVVGGNSLNSILTINANTPFSYSGILGGAGTNQNKLALVKTGSGVLTLDGNNSYTGTTTLSVGTMIVNGINTGTGAFAMASGTVLGGTGAIAANVTSTGGVINPGSVAARAN